MYRKVTTCECPGINDLSIETSSHLSAETGPRKKRYGDGGTEGIGKMAAIV